MEDAAAGVDAQAIGEDGQPLPPGATPPPPVPLTNAQVLIGLLTGFREVSCAVLGAESPRTTLDDPKIADVAKVLGPVFDKHHIDLVGMVGDYMLEVAAIITAGPILFTAARALNDEMKAKNAAKAKTTPADQTTAMPAEGDRAKPDNAPVKPSPGPAVAPGRDAAAQPVSQPSPISVGTITQPAFRE